MISKEDSSLKALFQGIEEIQMVFDPQGTLWNYSETNYDFKKAIRNAYNMPVYFISRSEQTPQNVFHPRDKSVTE